MSRQDDGLPRSASAAATVFAASDSASLAGRAGKRHLQGEKS